MICTFFVHPLDVLHLIVLNQLAANGAKVPGYRASGLLHDPHHLVSHGDPRYGTGHAAVLDVKVACADACQSHPDNGVAAVLQNGFRFVKWGKSSRFLEIHFPEIDMDWGGRHHSAHILFTRSIPLLPERISVDFS